MKKILILLICFGNFIQAQSIMNGLVAHYPFNGNANDASGNNHHGYISGGVIDSTDRFGNPNSAYYFDGQTNSFIKILNSPAINNFQQLSISLWYNKIDSIKYRSGIICKQRQFNTCGSCYFEPTFEFILRKDPIEQDMITRKTSIGNRIGHPLNLNSSLNNWYHIVYNYDVDSIRIYLNGVYQHAYLFPTNFSFVDDTSLIRIGYTEGVNGFSGTWKGFIDDIRIYNRSITKEEINELYQNTVGIEDNSSKSRNVIFYPNPTNSKELFIGNIEANSFNTVQIFDNLGKLIKTIKVSGDSFNHELSPGCYFMKILGENLSETHSLEKVIILE